jgi:two-component system, chemotaxis family, chemotaxis protein CheY
MRRMVVSSLGSLEVKSTQAGSGLEAIERLAIEPVDLIVLDLNMPDMHGMEVIDSCEVTRPIEKFPSWC